MYTIRKQTRTKCLDREKSNQEDAYTYTCKYRKISQISEQSASLIRDLDIS